MSIHCILGKPGSGKSLFATKKIIRELRESRRNIVTNVPLNIDRLNEYVQRKYPGEDLQLPQRLRLLSDEEMREFWKFRGPVAFAEEFPDDLPAFNFVPLVGVASEQDAVRFDSERAAYAKLLLRRDQAQLAWFKALGDSRGQRGVCYLLDECHIAFNARDWATIGRGALHYLSQHRKLGDIVYPITQSAGNLDKQFRSVSEDFTVLRNEYTAQYGIFKGRGRFTWKTYLKEPGEGKVEPFIQGTFRFDGEEKCYDTARGIGVHGNLADIGRRAKGISIMWTIPAGLLLSLSIVAIPWFMGRTAGKYVGGKGAEAIAKAEVGPDTSGQTAFEKLVGRATLKEGQGASVRSDPPLSVGERPKTPETGKVVPYPTGYAVGHGHVNVLMSDGSVVSDEDTVPGEKAPIDHLRPHSVEIYGVRMPFRPSVPQRPVPVLPSSRTRVTVDTNPPTPPAKPPEAVPALPVKSSPIPGVSSEAQSRSREAQISNVDHPYPIVSTTGVRH